ncbi:DUF1993 domain-containing protein [Leptospira sarikeiensis]|uniref:DUF1993 domain-containing protein n=1 Tax=Leptospira sarikeiensis TaxID=2484943 RepID=A0A4R9K8M9_9LEPT|nr:DUF1993 domain-containing protein [Leptospira sarikeiensis]TGL62047.1 DUF1993 domain-containing protein [Leptospira sarikeiensis]
MSDISIYELTVTQFIKNLEHLKKFLDKAVRFSESKKIDIEVLLNSRLAPDQYNFIRQVQNACDTAKLNAARLTGKQLPSHEDNEKTLAEVITRIDSVVDILKGLSPEDYKDAAEKKIALPRWEGKHLTGKEYTLHHIVPNFFFHIVTAYDILRHNGVELGKRDYLGEFPFRQ